MQQRSASKTAYPNHWDISASVHVSAGKTSLEAGEITKVQWISIPEFTSWINGKGELIVPHEEEYVRLLAAIRTR